MKDKKDVFIFLQEEGEILEIPEALKPEQMEKMLKQQVAQSHARKYKVRKTYKNFAAVAACLCMIFLSVGAFTVWRGNDQEMPQNDKAVQSEDLEEAVITEVEEAGISYPEINYEDIYTAMSAVWEENNYFYRGEMAEAGMSADDVVEESEVMEEAPAADFSESKKQMTTNDTNEIFGETNVQTVGVDEGDIVKNDGRYLYQKIQVEQERGTKWVIQIVDTKDGLKEVSRVDGIDGIIEFYIWEDVLVVIEEKYLDTAARKLSGGMELCYEADVAYFENYYHEITFFDITDRSQPKGIKRFTLQGQYASSRIADGYFYGFSRYHANPGEGEKDYDAYIPVVDGARLQAEKIYLPEKTNVTSYLVLVAIDLKNPTKFTDTTGIVSDGNLYYVSKDNIFVADNQPMERKDGWSSNKTELLRFSYDKGRFALRATGEVKGQLEGNFSMDEYEKHLRVVTTVSEYRSKGVTDDRTGEVIGYHIGEERRSNAVYVLDESLEVVGKIEDLAKDEQIYSARFMGDTGYFVTFRQVDPLFTVDLANPEEPKILSELKVSGFSEYLHIYGEDRLLGIGMEADEETGRQEGMKLSMFDISDKTNVTEIAKKNLTNYEYSEALYNHHAVLVSVGKNIFGFEAEGYKGGFYRDYMVYTYENDTFVQKLKLSIQNGDGSHYSSRGTFIGDTFYLLLGDGTVRSYDLNTGKALESLEP